MSGDLESLSKKRDEKIRLSGEIEKTKIMFSNKKDIILSNDKIGKNGYILSVDGFDKLTTGKMDDGVIWKAIPIGLTFLILFFLLQFYLRRNHNKQLEDITLKKYFPQRKLLSGLGFY